MEMQIGALLIFFSLGFTGFMTLFCRSRINRKTASMPEEPSTGGLIRTMSLLASTLMGVGMMIGAGVFLGIGTATWLSGPGGVCITFALAGILAMCIAMSFAELSSAYPETGGAFNYSRRAFGRGTSFITGWIEFFASTAAGGLYAVTFAVYTTLFLEGLGLFNYIPVSQNASKLFLTIAVSLYFLYTNNKGAESTGKAGIIFGIGQMALLTLLAVIAGFVLIRDPSRLANFNPFLPNGWLAIIGCVGLLFVAFEGYEVIAQTADDLKMPRRNLPKAMIYSVSWVQWTYVALAFTAIIAVKRGMPEISIPVWEWIGEFKEKGFGEAVSRLIPGANFILTSAIIFASTSALNATIYSGNHALYALARDGMLPKFFKKKSDKGVPYNALRAVGILLILCATVLPTYHLAASTSIMFLFLFGLVNMCAIKIRRHFGDELNYGFLMPLFPLFPVFAIIIQAILSVWLIHMSLVAWIIAPFWITSGLLIYNFYSKDKIPVKEDEVISLEEGAITTEIFPKELDVVIPVSNLKNSLNLATAARLIFLGNNTKFGLLNMAKLSPLSNPSKEEYEDCVNGAENTIFEGALSLFSKGETFFSVRFCRNIVRGIVAFVKQFNAKTIILGWSGRQDETCRLSKKLDNITSLSPSNVIIVKGKFPDTCREILVPISGGRNSGFALETAIAIAREQGSKVKILYVKSNGKEFDLKDFVAKKGFGNQVKIQIIQKTNSTSTIALEAEKYDLVIMGHSGRSSENITAGVACICNKPMIIVKSQGIIASFWKRWL